MTGRYDTTSDIEAQFETGSYGRVHGNKLSITEPSDECKLDYFAAVQAGMSNYEPMKSLVRRVLRETARNADD